MALIEFLHPLVGGLLIGGASASLLYFNGRIAGISGVLRGLFGSSAALFVERLLFLLGLVAGAALYELNAGTSPLPRSDFPPLLLAASGVLVGIGTSFAKGCTSGHGVCGLARFSVRSLAAVGTFLGTAIGTTYVIRHVFGIY
jgi:uncharacterized membrane protein YedE/YeeE